LLRKAIAPQDIYSSITFVLIILAWETSHIAFSPMTITVSTNANSCLARPTIILHC